MSIYFPVSHYTTLLATIWPDFNYVIDYIVLDDMNKGQMDLLKGHLKPNSNIIPAV